MYIAGIAGRVFFFLLGRHIFVLELELAGYSLVVQYAEAFYLV